MKNHQWKDDKCQRCGLRRKAHVFKQRMAIVGNTDYYKYLNGFLYYRVGDRTATGIRPNCIEPNS